MAHNFVSIKISKELHDCIMREVKKEFLENHPEYDGSKITFNLLVTQMTKYYLSG